MKSLIAILTCLLIALPAAAFDLEADLKQLANGETLVEPSLEAAQDGMSLSQAVDSVRRRGNVERIVSAQTRVEGDREMHHIRYMTKDGKVRTAKVRGRRVR
ncbi:MAG: hypothetical protein QNJ19_13190 [Woeseiaceae bacterium]|nr:hypothetical protein [Woeseiaceae bacterium]